MNRKLPKVGQEVGDKRCGRSIVNVHFILEL